MNSSRKVDYFSPQITDSKRSSTIFIDEKPYSLISFLSCGGSGEVRMFKSASGDKLAVKSPRSIAYQANAKEIMENTVDRSVYFYSLAYPEELVSYLLINNDDSLSYRMIMPFITGDVLSYTYLETELQNTLDFMLLVYCIAKELHRIHETTVIHGDVKIDNIIVQRTNNNEFSVHFIDFDLAYDMDEESCVATRSKWEKCRWFAPERTESIPDKIIKPDPNQDVFSFAYLIDSIIKDLPMITPKYMEAPSLFEFSRKAKSLQPEKRPTLKSFIEGMEKDIQKCSSRLKRQTTPSFFAIAKPAPSSPEFMQAEIVEYKK